LFPSKDSALNVALRRFARDRHATDDGAFLAFSSVNSKPPPGEPDASQVPVHVPTNWSPGTVAPAPPCAAEQTAPSTNRQIQTKLRLRILHLMLGQGLLLVTVGISVGLAAAVAITRVLSRFLPPVDATDWVLFVVAAGLAALALWTCYVPARPATRVPVTTALRHE
jgi:hypothetical protein